MALLSQSLVWSAQWGETQDVLKFVDGVAGRDRLLLEDIEARALDFSLSERTHHGCLVDDRARGRY